VNSNYAKNGPSRAVSDSSTHTSKNGRSISAARWNKPLFLTANSTTDLTPTAGFTAPDWILVARDGSNPTNATLLANMKFSTSNATSVVGRYAYAIYDEGGLLDANVAGCPSNMNSTSATTIKSAIAYADLTQLTNSYGPLLTTAQIDNLIGWRNFASARPSRDGAGNYSFSAASATNNYYNTVNSNSTGFVTVGNKALNSGESDRMFSSRQQLIQFFLQKLGDGTSSTTSMLQNALQYFSTFSRSLNQPSFAPDPDRPRIQAAGSSMTAYRGGNDANGADDIVNPAFLTIRVTSGFPRNDGSLAVAGEPLVNKRFDLRRLAWLTYKGPSGPSTANPSGRATSDSDMAQVIANGIDADFLKLGTDDNIKKYFGLTWNSDGSWTYSETLANSSGTQIIGTLALVQAAKREANFFELLKATINAGSLGKSSLTGYTQYDGGGYQHNLDISVDNQIIQIGANIIDQADADGYPTRIIYSSKWFRGTENLPSLYRTTTTWAYVTPPSPVITGYYSANQSLTVSDPGSIAIFKVPHIWNMHDPQDVQPSPAGRGPDLALGTPRPDSTHPLRIVAMTTSPSTPVVASLPPWRVQLDAHGLLPKTILSGNTLTGNVTLGLPQWDYPTGNATATDSDLVLLPRSGNTTLTVAGNGTATENATLTFYTNNGTLFREPTMLWKANLPVGSNLTTSGTSVPDHFDGKAYVGFYMGSVPAEASCSVTSASTNTTTAYIIKTTAVKPNAIGALPSQAGWGMRGLMTFQCQYQDPLDPSGNNYLTYDEKYWDAQCFQARSVWIDPDGTTYLKNPLRNGKLGFSPGNPSSDDLIFSKLNSQTDVISYDPRTARWNASDASDRAAGANMFADYGATTSNSDPCAPACVVTTERPGMAYVDCTHGFFRPGLLLVQSPAVASSECPPIMFYDSPSYAAINYGNGGMFTQNNPWVGATSPYHQFNADADGVTRRAMGAYVPVDAAGKPPIGLAQATATTYNATTNAITINSTQSQSRPIILNRPFKTVDELGYVFKGTPYKNLDFFTPESGDTALLDVFCVGDNSAAGSLIAGKVNLNTRQKPVLQALLSGAQHDVLLASSSLTSTETSSVAAALVARTSGTSVWQGSLANVGELVGRFVGNMTVTGLSFPSSPPSGYYTCRLGVPLIDWAALPDTVTYSGLSADLDDTVFSAHANAPYIQRLRQSAIRPLAACGQTRVWNLMIDLVAQTGRYPQSASVLQDFYVESEKRCWLHVAIDRLTGQVIDSQVETVTE